MSSTITVFCAITAKNGERVPLEVKTTITTTDLRRQAAEATKIPLDQLRLIFRGKMIKDDESLAVETYKLEHDCVLHCMGKPTESSSSSQSTPATSLAVASGSGSGVTPATAAVPTISPPLIPTTAATTSTAAAMDPLQVALQLLRTSHSPQIYATAVSTLSKILANIAEHPMEEKYRKVKQQNVAFAKRLGGLSGGDAAMRAVGFVLEQQEGVPVYQLYASADAWPKLMAAKATIDAAVVDAERSLNVPAPVSTAAATNPLASLPGMGGLPMPNTMNNPAMQSALAEMMSNPESMRAMFQASPLGFFVHCVHCSPCPRILLVLPCIQSNPLTLEFFLSCIESNGARNDSK